LLQMKDLPEDCNDENIGSSIQDNEWHFLVGTWDGGTLKLYIDGSLDAEMPCAGTLLTNDEPMFIGARGGTQRFLVGALDEIKVYNYALSPDEIARDMESPVTAVEPNDKLTTTWSAIKAQK
ncbi:MAG: LamG domain-containing protein, partial [Candidatus Poribacteria bacterium]